MKLSETIKQLQDLYDKHGEQLVFIVDESLLDENAESPDTNGYVFSKIIYHTKKLGDSDFPFVALPARLRD